MTEEMAPDRAIALDADVAQAFGNYHWPGNLRQLANALRAACALLDNDGTRIGMRHLAEDLIEELHHQKPRQRALPTTENLRVLSDSMIDHAVISSGGNMSEAARRLGISRNTLYRRLKRSHSIA